MAGTGGVAAGRSNGGVQVSGSHSTITSTDGAVSVTGIGGGIGSLTRDNMGVIVRAAGVIAAGGLGTTTVHGTGGAVRGGGNYGVLVRDADSMIATSGGNLTGTITAGGAGAVTVAGTGGATFGDENYGVSSLVWIQGSLLTTGTYPSPDRVEGLGPAEATVE